MRRPLIITASIAALAAALALGYWFARPGMLEHGDWHERRLVYLFEARNETGTVQRDRRLRVFLPPTVAERQERVAVESDRPLELAAAPGANEMAIVELGDVPPYGVREVRLDIRLRVRDRVAARAGHSATAVTRERRTRFPVDDPAFDEPAAGLQGGDELETLRRIHQWVGNHIEAVGYLAGDRGALYALAEGRGDCTEFMSLAGALALHAGMPVRAVGGFPYDEDRVAAASQFHNWIEVRAGDRWWVVDAQTGRFTDRMDEYLIVRRLSDPDTTGVGSQGMFMPMEGFDVRML